MNPVRPPDEHDVVPSGADEAGEEAGQEVAEEEEEPDEAMECRICKDPGEPSQQERDEHDVTHLPYRSWCRVCLEAKGKEDPHFRTRLKEVGEVPTIGLDYKSYGESP